MKHPASTVILWQQLYWIWTGIFRPYFKCYRAKCFPLNLSDGGSWISRLAPFSGICTKRSDAMPNFSISSITTGTKSILQSPGYYDMSSFSASYLSMFPTGGLNLKPIQGSWKKLWRTWKLHPARWLFAWARAWMQKKQLKFSETLKKEFLTWKKDIFLSAS